jgi:ribosome-binding factor A
MGVTREKMAAQLRRGIQAVLDRGLHDPRVTGLITVSRVELSPDFADATVHVTVMPADRADLTFHGLKSATSHIRSQVARKADFRRVPHLHFRMDVVRKRESDVLSAIARATAEDEAREAERAAAARAAGADADAGAVAGRIGDTGGSRPWGPPREPVDEDVLAAFDAFIDGTEGDAAAGEPAGHEASGTPDESTNGDRSERRPEDHAT